MTDEAANDDAAALRAAYIEAQAQPVCTPGEMAECRLYFREADGRLHCPMSHRICSDVGRWLPCGDFGLSAAGPSASTR